MHNIMWGFVYYVEFCIYELDVDQQDPLLNNGSSQTSSVKETSNQEPELKKVESSLHVVLWPLHECCGKCEFHLQHYTHILIHDNKIRKMLHVVEGISCLKIENKTILLN